MGGKDIAEKTLEAYDDVFSDIINVLLFDGREVVREDELSDASPLSQYKADGGSLHAQERDVAKLWRNGSVRICLYGLENQTGVDADIPLRVMGYDGAAYRAQLLSDRDGGTGRRRSARYPVVTLVLYFGEERWNRPRSLKECLDIPPGLEPFVSDYQVNVFEVAWLEPEVVQKFKSDFRIVADYFVQVRRNRDYTPSAETMRHVDEILTFMSVVTGDSRFADVQVPPLAEGGMSMCEVLDRVENRGVARGIATGRREGLATGRREGLAAGRREGLATGRREGQDAILALNSRLLAANRIDDLRRASTDSEYLRQLLAEQGILPVT